MSEFVRHLYRLQFSQATGVKERSVCAANRRSHDCRDMAPAQRGMAAHIHPAEDPGRPHRNLLGSQVCPYKPGSSFTCTISLTFLPTRISFPTPRHLAVHSNLAFLHLFKDSLLLPRRFAHPRFPPHQLLSEKYCRMQSWDGLSASSQQRRQQ